MKATSHLVTGAAGVIGFELVRQLLARGATVVAVDNFRKGAQGELRLLAQRSAGRLRVLSLDLAKPAVVESLPHGPFDVTYHLAAIVGVRAVTVAPYDTAAINTRSTLNLLDWARLGRTRAFLFASSSECYASGVDAGTTPVPTPENVPLTIGDVSLPRWSYAASKILGESAVFSAAHQGGGFLPLVVRFHNVYGPRMQPTHVVPEFFERCLQGLNPFPIFGAEQTRSFLYVEDAARAVMTVAERGAEVGGGLFHIGSQREIKIGDLAQMVFRIADFHPRLALHPAPPGSVSRRVPDVARMLALGFQASVELEDGLQRCWRALKAGSRDASTH